MMGWRCLGRCLLGGPSERPMIQRSRMPLDSRNQDIDPWRGGGAFGNSEDLE